MSIFKPTFDTYQDVKTTLAWWSSPIWALAIWFAWRFVLEASHRDWLANQLPDVAKWAAELGAVGASLAIGLLVAHVMVHFLEIHDHIWDRYVVRWRRRYVTSYIIPELLSPVLNRLPDDAMTVALENWRPCMKRVFYHFATDRDTRINKNLLVRFYERITKYWLTQLAEVAVVLLAFFSVIYAMLVTALTEVTFSTRFVWQWIAMILVFGLVRLAAIGIRSSVQDATSDEIEAIQAHPEFHTQVRVFCDEVGLALNAQD